jgi:ribosomal protein S12 methylthiotransferase
MPSNNLFFSSLGCAKNLVDSDLMQGRLQARGWKLCDDPADADVIVVNTCSFIESAANESIDTILELAEFKTRGRCRRLVVAGCLPERYRQNIVDAMPEVDLFLGTGGFDQIVAAVEDRINGDALETGCLLPSPECSKISATDASYRSAAYMNYIKIAEGCSKSCTYCVIPKLRGTLKSRPIREIVAEAHTLVEAGARELILIAQDTTGYGADLATGENFSRLLEQVAGVSEKVWVRFLYGHPESISTEVIDTVASHPNICAYFDIPIQHASTSVLRRMGRYYSREDVRQLVAYIRSAIPGAAIRTTAIVGFPGETDQDYQFLVDFVEQMRFDHLGVFSYSDAEDISSHRLSHHVAEELAAERLDRLMRIQRQISSEINKKYIGKVVKVLVEESPEKGLLIGRTFFQAPEVDGLTFLHLQPGCPTLKKGQFAQVKITQSLEYDLIGEPVLPSHEEGGKWKETIDNGASIPK